MEFVAVSAATADAISGAKWSRRVVREMTMGAQCLMMMICKNIDHFTESGQCLMKVTISMLSFPFHEDINATICSFYITPNDQWPCFYCPCCPMYGYMLLLNIFLAHLEPIFKIFFQQISVIIKFYRLISLFNEKSSFRYQMLNVG